MRINNELWMLCVVLLLSGCSPKQSAIETQAVIMPVSTSCHAPPITEPDWNVPKVAATASVNIKLSAILADLELSKAYIAELKAELAACS